MVFLIGWKTIFFRVRRRVELFENTLESLQTRLLSKKSQLSEHNQILNTYSSVAASLFNLQKLFTTVLDISIIN